MANYRYEIINVLVTAVETSTPFAFKTNPHYKKIVGMFIPTNAIQYADTFFLGEFSEPLKMNDKEILPKGYDLSLLMSSLKVSPDKKFYDFDIDSLGQTITGAIIFKFLIFVPRTVKIILKYEV